MDSSSQTTASAAAEAGGVSSGGNGAMIHHQLDDLSPMQSSAAAGVSAAGILADDPKQNLTHVIYSIQKTLGILHQLYLTVSSFNVAAQLPLLQRIFEKISSICIHSITPWIRVHCSVLWCNDLSSLIYESFCFDFFSIPGLRNTLVSELDNMTKLAENCNIQVPMDVINLIDDGKNPDEFTRNVLNGCIANNQIAKGKTDAYKGLRRHLLEELDLTFPDEVEAYREIRASSAAESKRLAQLQSVLPNGDVKVKAEN
ncbi:mediator of RNA polymerase II transcription subunit 10b-like isoform X1 [Primulina tabacum]|uniref:mediator of RNA polymerase II transcription subunit 10b-like isoform X1 n=1 Tax=Primulina tabacum TaxID=48773 RepID=UPI003F5A0B7C